MTVVLAGLTVAACAEDLTPRAEIVDTRSTASATFTPTAHPGLDVQAIEAWINSTPRTVAEELERGRVVLIDFWTYTCVNCTRTLPYLTAWDERYRDAGLTIIGVHSPEFEFEQQLANVEQAVRRFGIKYPVALDNEFETWDAFENRFWPAKYLLVPGAGVVYTHFGEGAYEETELAIRAALGATGHNVDRLPRVNLPPPETDPRATGQTRELYGGYRRNYGSLGGFAGQEEYYLEPDASHFYVDTGVREPDRWYLQGEWFNEPESITHNRRTEHFEDYIALQFRARSANVVLHHNGSEPIIVVVELDGRPLAPEEAGPDITFDAEGRSILSVTEGRLFEIVRLPAFGEHELRLRSNSNQFAVYAFTFGSYLEGA